MSSGLRGGRGSGTAVGEGDKRAGRDCVEESCSHHHGLVSSLVPLSPGVWQLLCHTRGWQRQLEVVDLRLASAAAASALGWAGKVLWSCFLGS